MRLVAITRSIILLFFLIVVAAKNLTAAESEETELGQYAEFSQAPAVDVYPVLPELALTVRGHSLSWPVNTVSVLALALAVLFLALFVPSRRPEKEETGQMIPAQVPPLRNLTDPSDYGEKQNISARENPGTRAHRLNSHIGISSLHGQLSLSEVRDLLRVLVKLLDEEKR